MTALNVAEISPKKTTRGFSRLTAVVIFSILLPRKSVDRYPTIASQIPHRKTAQW
jgi:hypothetical protein